MMTLLWGVVLVLSVPALAWGGCGLDEVCGDVTASLIGVVESELFVPGTVLISWSTPSENESIRAYRLSRYNCGEPRRCTEWVAYVNATGTCGQLQPYGVVDLPPPGTTWTYRLEVIRQDGVQGCLAEVTPE